VAGEEKDKSLDADPVGGSADRAIAVIDAEKFEAARRRPEVRDFLERALEQESQLERDGMIHS
jgi:hypothetical protein